MAVRCDFVLDEVDCYVHGVLSPSERDNVARHCQSCQVCKTALEDAEKRFEFLKSVPTSEASSTLIQSTLGAIDRYEQQVALRRKRLRRIGLQLATAVVLVFGGLYAAYWTAAPSPYEVRIVGRTKLHAGADGGMRVSVVSHDSGLGLGQVPVEIDLSDLQANRSIRLAHFVTDGQGMGQPHFRVPDWKDGTYDLRVIARTGDGTQSISRSVTLLHSWKLMVTSDRPVYQPGDTIHVRALALQSVDLKPVAGQPAVFTILDPRGNMVFKQKEVTSQYGICAGDCPLAREILEGRYTIQCQLGETTSKVAIEVKKYVLPKFKVEVTADQTFYLPGQRIGGTIKAGYFFGKPVPDASVVLKLRSTKGKLAVDEALTLRTNGEGDVTFALPPLPSAMPGKGESDASLDLIVTVTDSAGQKQARTVPIQVTDQPLRIEVIPEAGTLVSKVPNRVYFYVHRADGVPIRARINLTELYQELTTSDMGVAAYVFTPGDDVVEWTVWATDERAQKVTKKVRLEPGKATDDFLFRTDKAVYAGGDTISLTALGRSGEPVYVDFIKDGQMIYSASLPMINGVGNHSFDVPPELFGTVQVVAYHLEAPGMKNVKRRVLYIQSPRQIEIMTTMDRAEYRPGGAGLLHFQLKDQNGKPTPGAVSLAAVDEAVFAVLGQAPVAERDFYTLERDLLQPVLQLYPWSPTTSRGGKDEDQRLLDQALFATVCRQEGNDREGLINALLPFVENNRRVFDVLDNPQLDNLIDDSWIPKGVLDILRNPGGPQSLFASTYPENVRKAEATKATLRGLIIGAWVTVAIILVLAVVFFIVRAILASANPLLGIIGCLAIFFVCFGLLTPATQKVRDASARTQAFNDIKQIGLAIAEHNDVHKNPHILPPNANSGAPGFRIRDWFPETLLWRPELVTDDQGRANLDLKFADSITTWRLTASAVTADGRLGTNQEKIKVFQPFFVDVNLPVALTLGDEIALPVVFYNYLPQDQTVELTFKDASWFDSKDQNTQKLSLKAGEVRAAHFHLRARQVGKHELLVTAKGTDLADGVSRRVDVLPGGRRVEAVWNGTLSQGSEFSMQLPPDVIPGSGQAFVKFYPSSFSQVVEGLDGIFRLPYGCFEQTSSTTYPNVLALEYLRRNRKNLPAIEAKARHYVHLGYQRLLGFEVTGGGFDWFGTPPANRVLTAYGLMEFEDMARVHDVDTRLIERTRNWLLGQLQNDGSWLPEGHAPAGMPAGDPQCAELARLSTTAYIAWAVLPNPAAAAKAPSIRQFLLGHQAATLDDPYTLALMGNALLAHDPTGHDSRPYLERLEGLKQSSPDGKRAWWQQRASGRTAFYGSGRAGRVETTALACLAMLRSGLNPATARAALTWLVDERDADGTWHSTQATVLALKALLAAREAPPEDRERRLELTWNNDQKQEIVIPPDQTEVVKQLDLSTLLTTGVNTLKLAEPAGGATAYQVTFRYHLFDKRGPEEEKFALTVKYDRDKLKTGESISAVASVVNKTIDTASMVMVELPIPPGFVVEDSFAKLVEDGQIAKYELGPAAALIYLRELSAGKSLEIPYRLRATMPANVAVPAARVYEYYNPDRFGTSAVARLTVSTAK